MEKMKKINKDALVYLVFFVFIKPLDYCTELKKLDSIIDWVYRKVCVNFPIYSSGVILRRFIECLHQKDYLTVKLVLSVIESGSWHIAYFIRYARREPLAHCISGFFYFKFHAPLASFVSLKILDDNETTGRRLKL